MMTLVEGLPENVVGVSARGRVSAQDYQQVLIPAVEAALKKHQKIRFYYELGAEFEGIDLGAMWEDFTVGVGHWGSWERVAVVTDNEWIRHAVRAFGFIMPCPVKVFGGSEGEAARKWLVA